MRNPSMAGLTFKRIGVWQTAFLGDAVLTLPLLHTLVHVYPGAEIYYFVRKGLKALFQQDQGIQVIEFDKYGLDRGLSGLARNLGNIRSQGFDLWVSPHASFRSAIVSRLSGAPVRVGYDSPWFNRAAYTHIVERRFPHLEEIERVLQLLGPLGIDPSTTWPDMTLDPEAIQKAMDFWSGNINRPVLGIHPGSTWATKKWPEEYFARTIDMIHENLPVQIMLFAGPGEKVLAENVLKLVRHRQRVINMAGKLDLPGLAAFLDRLDCYLCNDSGPMHLAWTRNTPVVALFGPTTRSLGFFPRGKQATVLEVDLPCRPCGLHGSRSCHLAHHRCMLDISPEKVFKSVKDKLHV